MNEILVVIVRSVISFFSLLIFIRVLGKQEISQLTFFDYVNGITIGSIASILTTELNDRVLPVWVGLFTWTALVLLMQFVTLKSRTFSEYLEGEPVVVIMNGKIMEDSMRKMRYRVSELLVQLREKNIFDISQVEFAILETSGKLSVMKKTFYQPVTPKDLNISTNYQGLSTELIYDGVVLEQNLKLVNLDRNWLAQKLKENGISAPSEVMLAALNTQGELYLDKYQDFVKEGTSHE